MCLCSGSRSTQLSLINHPINIEHYEKRGFFLLTGNQIRLILIIIYNCSIKATVLSMWNFVLESTFSPHYQSNSHTFSLFISKFVQQQRTSIQWICRMQSSTYSRTVNSYSYKYNSITSNSQHIDLTYIYYILSASREFSVYTQNYQITPA